MSTFLTNQNIRENKMYRISTLYMYGIFTYIMKQDIKVVIRFEALDNRDWQ